MGIWDFDMYSYKELLEAEKLITRLVDEMGFCVVNGEAREELNAEILRREP